MRACFILVAIFAVAFVAHAKPQDSGSSSGGGSSGGSQTDPKQACEQSKNWCTQGAQSAGQIPNVGGQVPQVCQQSYENCVKGASSQGGQGGQMPSIPSGGGSGSQG